VNKSKAFPDCVAGQEKQTASITVTLGNLKWVKLPSLPKKYFLEGISEAKVPFFEKYYPITRSL